jgi:hypothetical protein
MRLHRIFLLTEEEFAESSEIVKRHQAFAGQFDGRANVGVHILDKHDFRDDQLEHFALVRRWTRSTVNSTIEEDSGCFVVSPEYQKERIAFLDLKFSDGPGETDLRTQPYISQFRTIAIASKSLDAASAAAKSSAKDMRERGQ